MQRAKNSRLPRIGRPLAILDSTIVHPGAALGRRSRLPFFRLMLLLALWWSRFLRRRGLLCLRLGRGLSSLRLRSWRMCDLWRRRFGFFLRRCGLGSRRLGRRGLSSLGLRSWRMRDLWRWCFDFFLRRCALGSRRLGRRGLSSLGLRSRRMRDLWRRCFAFFLRRRGRLLFGRRLRSGHGLTRGRRHCSRPRRGDISANWLYFIRRFWGRWIRRTALRGRGRCRYLFLLRSRRYRVVRSR
jgi:hypothetical protein